VTIASYKSEEKKKRASAFALPKKATKEKSKKAGQTILQRVLLRLSKEGIGIRALDAF
jgi:hypothetical protein